MAGGGYSPWEWMLGIPMVNAAGRATAPGPDLRPGPEWESKAFWYGGNSDSGRQNPYTITREDIISGDKNIGDSYLLNKTESTADTRKKRDAEYKEQERKALAKPSRDALQNNDGGWTSDGKGGYGVKSYQNRGEAGYPGDRPAKSLRDPFKPLPGMKHNPDPNADPFAPKQQGFTDPLADTLLGLIQGYDQLRSQGQTREMALTTLHYQPPQQMAMGGGGTGSGGSGGGSGGGLPTGAAAGARDPVTGQQPYQDPNSDDWGSRKGYTEMVGFPLINPLTDQDLPITGKGPKIFPERHDYPQEDLKQQYLQDQQRLMPENTDPQKIYNAEASLRNRRENYRDAVQMGNQVRDEKVKNVLKKQPRDEKLNDRRVQVDNPGRKK